MRQLPISDWPTGLDQDAAFITLSLREIARRLAVTFEHGSDDLDEFDGTVITLSGGTSFALQHYRNAPVDGIKIIVAPGDGATLVTALRLLRTEPRHVSWFLPAMKNAVRLGTRRPRPTIRGLAQSAPARRRTERVNRRRMAEASHG